MMFGPLNFPSKNTNVHQSLRSILVCFLCDEKFDADYEIDQFLNHIQEVHSVMIKNHEHIIDLSGYVCYWKEIFTKTGFEDIFVKESSDSCTSTSQKEGKLHCLSDKIKEDKVIRDKLMKESLEKALERQMFEREDTHFVRRCLFCNHDIKPTRAEYLNHLSVQHNLQLGKPDNLVYIDKFISLIENKIESLKCVFCEKTFKERPVLKEHMRKKLHKRVNPNNPIYDQFYMVNYLAPRNIAKMTSQRKRWRSPDSDDEDQCDWSDWQEETSDSVVCLFCPDSLTSWDAAINHLETQHGFHFQKVVAGLDFYQKVKMVNFIRHRVYTNSCIICDFVTGHRDNLLKHMEERKHFVRPKKEQWDQPEFFFPTYENDSFLCHLDSSGSSSEEETEEKVPQASPIFTSNMDKPLGCLLCNICCKTGEHLLEHMSDIHDFHYYDFTENFNFMDRVKLINYFKLRLSKVECVNCNQKFESHKVLLEHMKDADHFIAPPKEIWCKSEYQNSKNSDIEGIDTIDFLYALENIGGIEEAPMDEREERGEYSDLEDDDVPILCLFCKNGSTDWISALNHMVSSHRYDFLSTTKDLTFYQQVQLVNYTRQKVKQGECPVCQKSTSNLMEHLEKNKHFILPPKEMWDHSKYSSTHFVGDPFLSELNVRHATDFFDPPKVENSDEKEESSDWSDWDEDMKIIVKCLFCDEYYDKWHDVLKHMKESHGFDYMKLSQGLSFYDQVKIVNFIRKKLLQRSCIICDVKGSSVEEVVQHMLQADHMKLPEKESWDKNDYFAPTIENDGFLAHLDEDSGSDGE